MARPIEATPKVGGTVFKQILRDMQNPVPVTFPAVDMRRLYEHINSTLAKREKK